MYSMLTALLGVPFLGEFVDDFYILSHSSCVNPHAVHESLMVPSGGTYASIEGSWTVLARIHSTLGYNVCHRCA